MTSFERKPSKTNGEPSPPNKERNGIQAVEEPELHEEPPADEDPKRELFAASDDKDGDYGGNFGYEEEGEGEGEEGGEFGYEVDELEEDEAVSAPTLGEQRSLLSARSGGRHQGAAAGWNAAQRVARRNRRVCGTSQRREGCGVRAPAIACGRGARLDLSPNIQGTSARKRENGS